MIIFITSKTYNIIYLFFIETVSCKILVKEVSLILVVMALKRQLVSFYIRSDGNKALDDLMKCLKFRLVVSLMNSLTQVLNETIKIWEPFCFDSTNVLINFLFMKKKIDEIQERKPSCRSFFDFHRDRVRESFFF